MIQSLKLLQVNTLQLEQLLRAELEQNPLLEIEEDMAMDAEPEGSESAEQDEDRERDEADEYLKELEGGEESIDWEEYLDEGFDVGGTFSEEADPNEERYEPAAVYEETLDERLLDQLSEKKISERIKLLVQFLINSLDDDGYLRLTDKDIAGLTDAAPNEIEEALNILHRFDPAGVGARDLRECMALQLRASGMGDSLAMAIVAKHWALFEKLKIPEIARQLNVSPREVQGAIDVIKALDPKPGYACGGGKSAAIVPDLIVRKVDGKFIVALNDGSIPSLYINKAYADMIKRGSNAKSEVKDYVREKFNSATWFIKSIEQRRTTMLKVMYAIIARQKIFFEKGPPNLAPLKQQEIADDIGMHISTVSRVTSNKYAQTPHGIFELKYFFTEAINKERGARKPRQRAAPDAAPGISSGVGGAGVVVAFDVTAERIRSRIKQLIGGEDQKRPLTDQSIADILKGENIPAARRTVAKYREQMRIPTTRMRQKYE
jgi:RNA polymerase sigma-54 factor